MTSEPRVGLGSTVASIDVAHDSYRQAYQSLRIGRVLGLTSIVDWGQLGIYRVLAELGTNVLDSIELHPALARLRAADPSGTLLRTLDAYLDQAGDVKATAERLFIHRGTLYHRLARVESIGEVDLRRGADRLDLHLGIKLGQLAGHLPTFSTETLHAPPASGTASG